VLTCLSKGVAVTAGKILWGQIALVFLILLVGVWGTTQWTASQLGYQVQFGSPWFTISGMPI
jgi:type IV secretion system protein VirD4